MTTMKALLISQSLLAKHSALLVLGAPMIRSKCMPSQTLAMNPLLFSIFITFFVNEAMATAAMARLHSRYRE